MEFEDTEILLVTDVRRRTKTGQILLTPAVRIPDDEMWLWKNPPALASVLQGLEEAEQGLGQETDFSQYADMGIEE